MKTKLPCKTVLLLLSISFLKISQIALTDSQVVDFTNTLHSLFHVLNREQEFGWDRFFSFAEQTLLGVLSLHNHTPQILHRDLKVYPPFNCLY